MIKRLTLIVSLLSCLVSCKFAQAEYLDPVELGGTPKEVLCDSAEGSWYIDVYTNRPYTAEIITGKEWLNFDGSDTKVLSLEESTTLCIRYTVNTGFSRLGQIVLRSGSRADTLSMSQTGQYVRAVMLTPSELTVPAEGGTAELELATNVAPRDLKFTSSHSSVQSITYENCRLYVTVAPNTSRDTRHIRITASTEDECGTVTSSTAVVNQPIIK